MSSKVTPAVCPSAFDLAFQGNVVELQQVSETLGKAFLVRERDKNGSTLLHYAVINNQTEVMNYLIENGIDLDATNKEGNTALHLAAQNEMIDSIHILLTYGAKETLLNKEGKAPLHLACLGKNNDVIAALLKYDIDISVVDYQKCTPMHIIAECDNLEACEMFHDKAQSINTKQAFSLDFHNDNGLTPCHLAARVNSFKVLNFILENSRAYGYPIETVLGGLDKENSTPLHTAVDKGNTECIEVLLQHGASTVCTNHNLPPLHLACSQGRVDFVRLMVNHAGNSILTQQDTHGKTPLHYCAYSVNSGAVVSFIASRTMSNDIFDVQDNNGDSPLHKSVELGNLAVTKSLISLGANPLIRNGNGDNVLHIAAKRRHRPIIKEILLLSCMMDLCTEKNSCGSTPIHVALKSGDSELISAVVKYDQHFPMQDKNGNSYLHLAAENGNKKALKILLNSSIGKQHLNSSNDSGSTPLHFAALSGNTSCVQLLLRRGAMGHKCNRGRTPLMLACKEGHTDSAKLLYKAHSFLINWKDNEGNTALHFAAKSNNPSMIDQMLNISSCMVCQNIHGETFFNLIVASKCQQSALAVVNHDRWQECIDSSFRYGEETSDRSHPMISLINVMPDVASAILDRSHTKSNEISHAETYDFKYINSTQKHLSSAIATTTSVPIHNDSCLNIQQKEHPLARYHHVPSMKVLQAMMKHRRVGHLSHPLVTAYLTMKWKNYGTGFYMFSFIFLVLLVSFLSAFVLIVPNPSMQTLLPKENKSNITESMSRTPDLSSAAQSLRVVVLVFNTLLSVHFVFSTLGLGLHFLNIIRYISKWIYAAGLICNYVFLLTPNPLDVWPVGSIACFLSWFMMILSMEFLGVIGLYVEMFTTVLQTVIQVLFICFFLLMAFAFSFYVLASSFSSFSQIGYSLFTIIGYMVGDISFDTFVAYDLETSPNGNFVLIFIVLVSVVVTIVMVNLLVGLAVGDIERVKQNALLKQRTAEIEMFTAIDRLIPNNILCRLNQSTYTIEVKTQSSRFKQTLTNIFQAVGDDVTSTFENTRVSNDSRSGEITDSETIKELAVIKEELKSLKEIIMQLHFTHPSPVQAEESIAH